MLCSHVVSIMKFYAKVIQVRGFSSLNNRYNQTFLYNGKPVASQIHTSCFSFVGCVWFCNSLRNVPFWTFLGVWCFCYFPFFLPIFHIEWSKWQLFWIMQSVYQIKYRNIFINETIVNSFRLYFHNNWVWKYFRLLISQFCSAVPYTHSDVLYEAFPNEILISVILLYSRTLLI